MSDRLKGRVAVVTGSGQGIGRAIAIAMAKEGAKVVTNNRRPNSTSPGTLLGDYFLASLSEERREWVLKRCAELTGDAESTAREIRSMGGEAIPFFGDVSDFETAGRLIQTAVDNFGKIDILVNNAGTFSNSRVWEMTEEVWDHVTANKPKSYFNCIRHASPPMMKQRWGRIINCTSRAWLGNMLDHCNYCAASAGVVGLTQAVARELYDYGITCNAIAPSAMTRATVTLIARYKKMAEVGTPMVPNAGMEMIEKTPSAEAVGTFMVYLATNEAANITGTVFFVRGSHIGIFSEPVEKKIIDKKEGLWTIDELMEMVPKELLGGYKNPAEKT